jgi:HD-GYP domain-containing protein (c-di-GMP phosphodiesterase class II)
MAVPAIVLGKAVPESARREDLSAQVIYYPVDLDGLVVDSVLDFNLYLPAGPDRFTFFRSPNLPFSVLHRNRLLEHDVRTVYIRAEEQNQYNKYLEQNIGAVLDNPEIPGRKKATLLYAVSKNVVREAFDEPRASAIVPRARNLATETVDFVLRSERALSQLASVMATDYYTYTHSINVCVFSVALAQKAGVAREDIGDLATGALLHDLGKSQVPKDLLTRVGPLSEDEMSTMRAHVGWGEQLLADHGGLSDMVMLPVSLHHEKLDGSGYPRQVRADDIHLFGRIAAIADCFDAMTTTRSYQGAMTAYEALLRMRTTLRDHYDQGLLEQFIRLLRAPDAVAGARKVPRVH